MVEQQFSRRRTRTVQLGTLAIGGDNPISVQSMTTTKTSDVTATISQIAALQQAGCEIVRLAVPDMAAAMAVSSITLWAKPMKTQEMNTCRGDMRPERASRISSPPP